MLVFRCINSFFLTCNLKLIGLPHFQAPEIARGQGLSYGQLRYHSQVDYWSFGLVVFECITGIRPLNAAQAQNKGDAHICHLPDENGLFLSRWRITLSIPIFRTNFNLCSFRSGKARYLKHIPKPHHLNPHLEAEVVPWLKLMLLQDEGKRGGENNEWVKILTEKISPVKLPVRVLV